MRFGDRTSWPCSRSPEMLRPVAAMITGLWTCKLAPPRPLSSCVKFVGIGGFFLPQSNAQIISGRVPISIAADINTKRVGASPRSLQSMWRTVQSGDAEVVSDDLDFSAYPTQRSREGMLFQPQILRSLRAFAMSRGKIRAPPSIEEGLKFYRKVKMFIKSDHESRGYSSRLRKRS